MYVTMTHYHGDVIPHPYNSSMDVQNFCSYMYYIFVITNNIMLNIAYKT